MSGFAVVANGAFRSRHAATLSTETACRRCIAAAQLGGFTVMRRLHSAVGQLGEPVLNSRLRMLM